ncbi:MAG: hypothetical protein VZQ62_01025 [Methanosphaera sp.]|nr:hypothetical protein [Methanosphaera sp.]
MNNVISFILNNWYLIVGGIAIIALVVARILGFIKLPTDKQLERVKEWLKYAVMKAEKELGTGTGQAKLRLVYDWFITRFPIFSKVIAFNYFSKLVDFALEWLNKQLEENEAIQNYVYGDDEIEKQIIDEDNIEFYNLM